jgi:pyrimidine operon attenuation protein/uracil phosphoribosyltransferase
MNPILLEPILAGMVADIQALQLENPLIIGIHTGGAWIARYLHTALGISSSFGTLDISFYRDDFSRVGINPKVKSSYLPESVDNRQVLLVDDVLHTGRTIRAGLNEIFSYGRPNLVRLAVAMERSGRELPVQADVTGLSMILEPGQQAKLSRNGDQLQFNIVTSK